ncbi:hypothetical protein I3760_16G049400 [Carya illinoinensis]|nr:hypothetical protein I3760_16G049400 [Carya illinoinensis]
MSRRFKCPSDLKQNLGALQDRTDPVLKEFGPIQGGKTLNRIGAEFLFQIVHGAIPREYFESNFSVPAAELSVCVLDYLYQRLNEVWKPIRCCFTYLLPYIEGLDSWLFEGSLDDPFEEMFFYVNRAIPVDEADFWEKSYLLTLSEIFFVSLAGLIGHGDHISRYFLQDNHCKTTPSFDESLVNKLKVEHGGGETLLPRLEKIWYKFLVDTLLQKRVINSKSACKDASYSLDAKEENMVADVGAKLPLLESFCTENPVITVCKKTLRKNMDAWKTLNLSRNFYLPPLNDEILRKAVFGNEQRSSHATQGTNYAFGFQFSESEYIRSQNDTEMLEVLFPFPTLLPTFQDDLHMSELLPFQNNSTLASRVLTWIQNVELRTTPLPLVIMQECLTIHAKKQVHYVGKHILSKLMTEWRLMDELAVSRAIYLLGSGDLVQHFLTVIFNKLDKGETWDDDFELNTILQKSIRNSADGMLLSAPDALVVSIAKTQGVDGDQPNIITVASTPRKSRVHSFGIDGLDLLKFTYKVLGTIIPHENSFSPLLSAGRLLSSWFLSSRFLSVSLDLRFCVVFRAHSPWMLISTPLHERTKHIEVDCHSIREAFEARVITLPHIFTELQIADIFTKALTRHRHYFLIFGGIVYIIKRKLKAKAFGPRNCQVMGFLLKVKRAKFALDKARRTYNQDEDAQVFITWINVDNFLKITCLRFSDLYDVPVTLQSRGTAESNRKRHWLVEQKLLHFVDAFHQYVMDRVLSFKLNVGHFTHLADLVMRINYNYFYMSDGGNLMIAPSSETDDNALSGKAPYIPVLVLLRELWGCSEVFVQFARRF